MDLDDIVARLNKHHQRASYGAVAGVLGRRTARGLMGRHPKNPENSWVVAATTDRRTESRRGWPTGYAEDQIHPACLRQIGESVNDFIEDIGDLRKWLNR